MELYAFVLLRRNDCYSFAKKKMLLVYIFVNIQIVEGEFNGPKASGLNGYIYIYIRYPYGISVNSFLSMMK